MTDVFLSYSKKDVGSAERFTRALESHGLSVWWDRKIPPGQAYRDVIKDAIDSCSALVVLWTETSVQSKWVAREADRGAKRSVLVPVLLDAVEQPWVFEDLEAAELSDWDFESPHAEFDHLLEVIRSLVDTGRADDAKPEGPVGPDEQSDQSEEPVPPADPPSPILRRIAAAAGFIGPLVLLLVLSFWTVSTVSLDLDPLDLAGLKVGFASDDGALVRAVPTTAAVVLPRRGSNPIGSVVMLPDSGDVVTLSEVSRLELRSRADGGVTPTMSLAPIAIPRDSTLEIQAAGEGTYRFFLPGGAQQALLLKGRWAIIEGGDTTVIAFGSTGGASIVIATQDPVSIDLYPDEREGRVLVLDSVEINELRLSRLPAGGSTYMFTVNSGTLTSEWLDTSLTESSAPEWASFSGIVDSLWFGEGALQASIRGGEVTGFRLDGSPRMPGVLRALPDVQQWGLVVLLIICALGSGYAGLRKRA